jgi:DNA-directed RNA polymerase subunit M/transcription elongation factor TFIIS
MVSVVCEKCSKEMYEHNSILHEGVRYCKNCYYKHRAERNLVTPNNINDKMTKEIRKSLGIEEVNVKKKKVKTKKHGKVNV